MTWYVYIIRCVDGSLYTGVTPDVERRFREHREGRDGRYTRLHKPIRVEYKEPYDSEREALKRERQLTGWTRKKKEWLIARRATPA